MNNSDQDAPSPNWSTTPKLIVGLTIAGLLVAGLFALRGIIGPLLLSFVLAYLLHPLANTLSNTTHLSWRMSVNLIFLLLLLILAGLSTAAGIAITQQTQSLIRAIERIISDLPTILSDLSEQSFIFGPFVFSLEPYLDVNTLSNQVISIAQPLLGRAGTLVSSFAAGAANIASWTLFVILIAYFTLADAGKVPDAIRFVDIPGYTNDIRRIGRELGRIWNAFLRGQFSIVTIIAITNSILLTILGVRYGLALGILAGFSRFVPYVGQAVSWIALGLVVFFQESHYFHLDTIQYAILVLALSFILDQFNDNIVAPRVMGQTLGVSPGLVLIVAIISLNLIGVIGLILAAPVLATIQLLGRYVLRKMLDLDPWPPGESKPRPQDPITQGHRLITRLRVWWRSLRRRK